jgi:uncharacterized protein DUF2782
MMKETKKSRESIMRRLLAFTIILIPVFAFGEDPGDTKNAADIPDVPMPVESGETLEPDITIIRRGKKTIQEYRINGRLYKVKVIPDIGLPYYFIDGDGDGTMEIQRSGVDELSNINQWTIFSWD